MPKHSKRFAELDSKVDPLARYGLKEALALVKTTASAKFDETVEVALKLNVNPAKGEENVRGTLVLPHGTGKSVRVAVFAEGDAAKAALEAGADRVGTDDLVEAIQQGWDEFDVLVAQPQLMRIIGPLGKMLGPRMPSKKAGNVLPDVEKAVEQLKAGRIEYRVDRTGVIHCPVGKVSFSEEQLLENLMALLQAIQAARPATVAGRYILSAALSTTMGPGIRLDLDAVRAKAA
ncbi:MAG: 50S ribosomal protein L1 [candidate division WS1 bacterium]|jgi:large subunit ribosomal protein L1|nr:50S ribosomal protein L1 [candidate division WS1 bacterium]